VEGVCLFESNKGIPAGDSAVTDRKRKEKNSVQIVVLWNKFSIKKALVSILKPVKILLTSCRIVIFFFI
jgi:hypothetical protein